MKKSDSRCRGSRAILGYGSFSLSLSRFGKRMSYVPREHSVYKRGLTVPGASGDRIVPVGRFVVVQKRLPRQFGINRPCLMRSRGSTTARPQVLIAPRYHGTARTVHITSVALCLAIIKIFSYMLPIV